MDQVITGEFSPGPKGTQARECIRVIDWNIERGLQFLAIVDFLRAADADLILLQEVDMHARRTRYLDVSLELARTLRLNYVFGKEFHELGHGTQPQPAYHGSATLSPWPLSCGRVIRFQQQSAFWKPRWYVPTTELFQRRLGGRIALVCEALMHGRTVTAYNLHLESKGSDGLRVQQLSEAVEDSRLQRQSSLIVMGGDFNLHACGGDAEAVLNSAGLYDAVRLPERSTTAIRGPLHKGRTIDWLYASGCADSDGRVHDDVHASDHYPLSARVQIRGC
jgi:endonuclease/exonuclease/phosphatase family metal-dependent hydrolase